MIGRLCLRPVSSSRQTLADRFSNVTALFSGSRVQASAGGFDCAKVGAVVSESNCNSKEETVLHLNRREAESIIIPGHSIELVKNWQGDHIEVVVLAIDGNSVKLGIDCPKDLDVWRYEIWRAERRAMKREEAAYRQ